MAPPKPYAARPEQCISFFVRGKCSYHNPASNETLVVPRMFISGQYTHRVNKVADGPEMLMLLVMFYPSGLHALTGLPAHELLNGGFALNDLWPATTRNLMEQLEEAESYAAMIQRVDDFLLAQYRQRQQSATSPVQYLLHSMLQSEGMPLVEKLAYDACLSLRQLERLFDLQCGINPSTMMQIVRFDKAYRLRLHHPQYSWLRIAMECGFHDYQHLSKAFQKFAGASPKELFSAEAQAPEQQLGLFRPGQA